MFESEHSGIPLHLQEKDMGMLEEGHEEHVGWLAYQAILPVFSAMHDSPDSLSSTPPTRLERSNYQVRGEADHIPGLSPGISSIHLDIHSTCTSDSP